MYIYTLLYSSNGEWASIKTNCLNIHTLTSANPELTSFPPRIFEILSITNTPTKLGRANMF